MYEEIDAYLKDAEERMNKTVSVLRQELSKVRTGRASSALVADVVAEYYGNPTPLNQMANITIPDPSSIVIQPWDETTLSSIEQAIIKSDLGITPLNDGKIIRLSIPPLSEERRKELAKYASKVTEDHKVAIRQIRKDTNNHIKESKKNDNVPEDVITKNLTKIQDLTDKKIKEVDDLFQKKQKEILEI